MGKAQKRAELRNCLLFFSGKTVSVILSAVYTFAIGLYVLKQTGSGFSFAVTIAVQILPVVLLGPFAGVLADRLSNKAMIIGADLFCGLLFFWMALISPRGLSVLIICLVTFWISVAETLSNLCIDSSVPYIVSQGNISRLNAAGKVMDSASAVIGPAAGGLLIAVMDLRALLIVNAASYLFSALMECFTDFRLYGKKTVVRQKIQMKKDLAEGFAAILKTPWIKKLLLTFLFLNFFMGLTYSVPLPDLLNNFLHLPAWNYGLVQSALPVGMILGAFLCRRISAKVPFSVLIKGSMLALSVGVFLIGLFPVIAGNPGSAPVTLYYGIVLLLFGIFVSLIDIPFLNEIQINVPDEIRGRVLSAGLSLAKAASPAGYLLSGALLQAVPVCLIPLAGGALSFLTVLIPAFRRAIIKGKSSGRIPKPADQAPEKANSGL